MAGVSTQSVETRSAQPSETKINNRNESFSTIDPPFLLDSDNDNKQKRKENIYMTELKTGNDSEDNQFQKDESNGDQQQQPEWSINYKTNNENLNSEHISPLSTRELIYWSFQIARGMDYLSSKKVSTILAISSNKEDESINQPVFCCLGYSRGFGRSQRSFSR